MLAFEDTDFIVKELDLLVYVLVNALCFGRIVESVFMIALLDLLDDFGLIFLEHMLYFDIDFLFALC